MENVVDFIKRVTIYLLVCFAAGHVIAQDLKSQKTTDDSYLMPALTAPFFQ